MRKTVSRYFPAFSGRPSAKPLQLGDGPPSLMQEYLDAGQTPATTSLMAFANAEDEPADGGCSVADFEEDEDDAVVLPSQVGGGMDTHHAGLRLLDRSQMTASKSPKCPHSQIAFKAIVSGWRHHMPDAAAEAPSIGSTVESSDDDDDKEEDDAAAAAASQTENHSQLPDEAADHSSRDVGKASSSMDADDDRRSVAGSEPASPSFVHAENAPSSLDEERSLAGSKEPAASSSPTHGPPALLITRASDIMNLNGHDDEPTVCESVGEASGGVTLDAACPAGDTSEASNVSLPDYQQGDRVEEQVAAESSAPEGKGGESAAPEGKGGEGFEDEESNVVVRCDGLEESDVAENRLEEAFEIDQHEQEAHGAEGRETGETSSPTELVPPSDLSPATAPAAAAAAAAAATVPASDHSLQQPHVYLSGESSSPNEGPSSARERSLSPREVSSSPREDSSSPKKAPSEGPVSPSKRPEDLQLSSNTPEVELQLRSDAPEEVDLQLTSVSSKVDLQLGSDAPEVELQLKTDSPKVDLQLTPDSSKVDLELTPDTLEVDLQLRSDPLETDLHFLKEERLLSPEQKLSINELPPPLQTGVPVEVPTATSVTAESTGMSLLREEEKTKLPPAGSPCTPASQPSVPTEPSALPAGSPSLLTDPPSLPTGLPTGSPTGLPAGSPTGSPTGSPAGSTTGSPSTLLTDPPQTTGNAPSLERGSSDRDSSLAASKSSPSKQLPDECPSGGVDRKDLTSPSVSFKEGDQTAGAERVSYEGTATDSSAGPTARPQRRRVEIQPLTSAGPACDLSDLQARRELHLKWLQLAQPTRRLVRTHSADQCCSHGQVATPVSPEWTCWERLSLAKRHTPEFAHFRLAFTGRLSRLLGTSAPALNRELESHQRQLSGLRQSHSSPALNCAESLNLVCDTFDVFCGRVHCQRKRSPSPVTSPAAVCSSPAGSPVQPTLQRQTSRTRYTYDPNHQIAVIPMNQETIDLKAVLQSLRPSRREEEKGREDVLLKTLQGIQLRKTGRLEQLARKEESPPSSPAVEKNWSSELDERLQSSSSSPAKGAPTAPEAELPQTTLASTAATAVAPTVTSPVARTPPLELGKPPAPRLPSAVRKQPPAKVVDGPLGTPEFLRVKLRKTGRLQKPPPKDVKIVGSMDETLTVEKKPLNAPPAVNATIAAKNANAKNAPAKNSPTNVIRPAQARMMFERRAAKQSSTATTDATATTNSASRAVQQERPSAGWFAAQLTQLQ